MEQGKQATNDFAIFETKQPRSDDEKKESEKTEKDLHLAPLLRTLSPTNHGVTTSTLRGKAAPTPACSFCAPPVLGDMGENDRMSSRDSWEGSGCPLRAREVVDKGYPTITKSEKLCVRHANTLTCFVRAMLL